MTAWPRLEDLIGLFEADPSFDGDESSYPADGVTFTTQRGATEVECSIEPWLSSLTIRTREAGEQRMCLRLWGLVDVVTVDVVHGHEALVATMVPAAGFQELRLELKPSPNLTWATDPKRAFADRC